MDKSEQHQAESPKDTTFNTISTGDQGLPQGLSYLDSCQLKHSLHLICYMCTHTGFRGDVSVLLKRKLIFALRGTGKILVCWFHRERSKSLDESSARPRPGTAPRPHPLVGQLRRPCGSRLLPRPRQRAQPIPARPPPGGTFPRVSSASRGSDLRQDRQHRGGPGSSPSRGSAPLLRRRRGAHPAPREPAGAPGGRSVPGGAGAAPAPPPGVPGPSPVPVPAPAPARPALPEPPHGATAGVPAAKQKAERERRAGKGRAGRELRPER